MGMLMEELAEELAWEMARELARELLRGLMRELAGCRHKCWQISLWGSCLGSWPGFLRGNWRRSWWGCWRKLVLLRLDMVQKSEKSYQFFKPNFLNFSCNKADRRKSHAPSNQRRT